MITFIKEQHVWISKTFYLKSPTYRALTSKKELGFHTMQFKPSVHNWAGLMMFERTAIFRKEKQELVGPSEEFSFSSSNHVSSSFRQGSEWFASTRRRQQMEAQASLSALVWFWSNLAHTWRAGQCAGSKESKMVKAKCCLPGPHDVR